MEKRLDYMKAAPETMRAMSALNRAVNQSGLEKALLELVKLRASQLNGCGYCIDMHSKDARTHGETEQRLYALSAWRETPFYTERERAALEWTENVTLISQSQVSDALYARMQQHFTDEELVNLTMAIVVINGWNRLAIPFRDVPGSYEPDHPVTQSS